MSLKHLGGAAINKIQETGTNVDDLGRGAVGGIFGNRDLDSRGDIQ